MSPVRIETRSVDSQGIKHIHIREAQNSFSVGPADAIRILDISRTSLFQHDGPDVSRVLRNHKMERVYSDEALLRIAVETGKVHIRQDHLELTHIESSSASAVLDVPWVTVVEIFTGPVAIGVQNETSSPQE